MLGIKVHLIFTSQPSLVVKFGVHSSLYQSCLHQIVHGKCNPKICYLPPYECEVRHYEKVNTLFADQSMSFLGIIDFLIQMGIKEYIYLIKPLMSTLTQYQMRLSFVMIEILIASIVNGKRFDEREEYCQEELSPR